MADRRAVLITGAAQGIGRTASLQFAARGYDVALVDIDQQRLEDAVSGVEAAGGGALMLSGDLADLQFAEEAVRRTASHFGRLDVLVNNAAWRELQTMATIGVESWQRTLQICLTAPAFMSRWAAEHMSAERGGVILNVSSMMSQRAGGVSPAYVVAKGGLDSLTYELAALYGPRGIRVLAVNPGAIDTQLSADYTAEDGQSVAAEMRRWSEDAIPLRRWARPEEIGRALVMLSSDDASYLHGTTILLDGGWLHSHLPGSLLKKMHPEQFR